MSDERRDVPGLDAEKPTEIPATGWWQVIRRAWAEAKADQVPLLAAGVAFFGFLSLFPAVVAGVLAYGLVADPAQIRNQVKDLAATMPASGRDLLLQQLDALTSAPRQGLGIGVAIAVVAALWSASGGAGYLLTAVNLAYDEDESRGFVRRKVLALGLTLGAIVFVLLAAALFSVGAAIGNDVPAPVRFVPPYDNVGLAHDDRTRLISEEHRRFFGAAALTYGCVLVDGFAAALWRTERVKKTTSLIVRPFDPLSKAARVVGSCGEGVGLEAAPVVGFEDTGQQLRHCVVAKVRRQISNAQP